MRSSTPVAPERSGSARRGAQQLCATRDQVLELPGPTSRRPCGPNEDPSETGTGRTSATSPPRVVVAASRSATSAWLLLRLIAATSTSTGSRFCAKNSTRTHASTTHALCAFSSESRSNQNQKRSPRRMRRRPQPRTLASSTRKADSSEYRSSLGIRPERRCWTTTGPLATRVPRPDPGRRREVAGSAGVGEADALEGDLLGLADAAGRQVRRSERSPPASNRRRFRRQPARTPARPFPAGLGSPARRLSSVR